MSILQERLPCSSFYFRQRRMFKHSLAAAENGDVTMSDQQFDAVSRGSRNSMRSKASQQIGGGGSNEMTSYVTAIA